MVKTDTDVAAKSSYDKLIANADGSVDLYFGPTAPAGKESNWVKTIPGRGWWVWFRFYGPTEPFFDKSWKLPDFEKVELSGMGLRHAKSSNQSRNAES